MTQKSNRNFTGLAATLNTNSHKHAATGVAYTASTNPTVQTPLAGIVTRSPGGVDSPSKDGNGPATETDRFLPFREIMSSAGSAALSHHWVSWVACGNVKSRDSLRAQGVAAIAYMTAPFVILEQCAKTRAAGAGGGGGGGATHLPSVLSQPLVTPGTGCRFHVSSKRPKHRNDHSPLQLLSHHDQDLHAADGSFFVAATQSAWHSSHVLMPTPYSGAFVLPFTLLCGP